MRTHVVTRSFSPPTEPVDLPGLGRLSQRPTAWPGKATADSPVEVPQEGDRGQPSGGSPAPRHATGRGGRGLRRWPITVAHHDDCGV